MPRCFYKTDRFRLLTAGLLALFLHLLFALLAFFLATPKLQAPAEPNEVVFSLYAPAASTPSTTDKVLDGSVPPKAKEIFEQATRRRSRPTRSGQARRATQLPPAAEPGEGIATAQPPGSIRSEQPITANSADLSKLDLEPSPAVLDGIASTDARVRRKLAERETGPFVRQMMKTTNLPAGLDPFKIHRDIDALWKPDWNQNLRFAKSWVESWLTSWQKEVRESNGGESNPPPAFADNPPLVLTPDVETASDTISVIIALEPLADGKWFASIERPSDHPIFDKQALADVTRAAELFEPWPEGYGTVLFYRLTAKFIVVPPSPSTLIGFNCAFPFCTPEEFKNLKIYHWFKKVLQKNVVFEGFIEPPAASTDEQEAEPGHSSLSMVRGDGRG